MASSARRLGVIGAGNIGGAIRLPVGRRFAVAVHDTDPAPRRPRPCGSRAGDTPAAVAERSEITSRRCEARRSWSGGARWSRARRGRRPGGPLHIAPATIRSVGQRFAPPAAISRGAAHRRRAGPQATLLVFMVGGDPPSTSAAGRSSEASAARLSHGPARERQHGEARNSLLAFTATWSSLEASPWRQGGHQPAHDDRGDPSAGGAGTSHRADVEGSTSAPARRIRARAGGEGRRAAARGGARGGVPCRCAEVRGAGRGGGRGLGGRTHGSGGADRAARGRGPSLPPPSTT